MSYPKSLSNKPIKIAQFGGIDVLIWDTPLTFIGKSESRVNTMVIQMDQGIYKGIEILPFESQEELTELEQIRLIQLVEENLPEFIKNWIEVNVYGHKNLTIIE